MLGILERIIFGNPKFENNSDVELSMSDSKKLLELKELFIEFEYFLPTNSGHLNPLKPNHLDELKKLRDLVSKIKLNLKSCFYIINSLDKKNYSLHDSFTSCDMILGILQSWDNNEIISSQENIRLNRVLVIFSRKIHDVLNEIKF
jgi:hypothetical protein